MKLERFKVNENREMYFLDNRKPSEDELKFDIIEKLSEHWNEKLKNEYFVPRALYKYSLEELREIEKFYITENVERDEDIIAAKLGYLGWGDIMHTQRVEEFEATEYFSDEMNDEEYADAMSTWLYDISDGSIQESVENAQAVLENFRIIEPKNKELENTLKELKEKHMSNEAVEEIRIEGNDIVFDVKCETDIQGCNEYNGVNLRYNKLCEIPVIERHEATITDDPDNDELDIIEHAKLMLEHWKIK